jgi:hypothetical protein
MKHSGIKRGAVASLICGAALLAGCSHTAFPKNLPLIKEYEAVSLTGVSLIVTNAEKDSAEHDILTDEGEKSGFRANRQAWSKRLVEALARELARRGAQVRSDAPVTLDLTLPEVTFTQTKALYQFRVKVVVSSSTGWSKNYEGVAGSNRYGVWSASAEADRLAGQALAEVVKAMLGDAGFLAHLVAVNLPGRQ